MPFVKNDYQMELLQWLESTNVSKYQVWTIIVIGSNFK